MEIDNGNNKSSPDSDPEMRSIIEETSAELNHIEHSPKGVTRKSLKTCDGEKKDMERITEHPTKTGNEDEAWTSPFANNGDNRIVGSNRDSNFSYREIDDDHHPELNNWDKTQKHIRSFRFKCGKLVNNDRVQYGIVVCIFINAAMMGIATYPFIKKSDLAVETFQKSDRAFLIIFTVELILQFIYHGFAVFLDGLLVFDMIVVIPSWFQGVGTESFQIIRAFRIFRAFKLVTRVKILKDLILAIISVLPRMAAIFLMLLLIFYIFAVMFTQLYSGSSYDDSYPDEELRGQPIIYFKSLEQSMLTLFQLMTMDEWATIVRALAPTNPNCWIFLITFVIISGFIVVNLIVAVICDAIGSLSDPEKAMLEGRYNDSDSDSDKMPIREQLETIEDQIGDLTRIQARTFHTLQFLTQQLQVEKEKTAALTKPPPSMPEDKVQKPFGDTKDKRAGMKKNNSGERSRRKGFAQAGFISKRKNYTDTWTQEGSDKTLRKAMITNFAKSARELQKMRNIDETNFARSLRELREMRNQDDVLLEEEKKLKTFE